VISWVVRRTQVSYPKSLIQFDAHLFNTPSVSEGIEYSSLRDLLAVVVDVVYEQAEADAIVERSIPSLALGVLRSSWSAFRRLFRITGPTRSSGAETTVRFRKL